MTKLLNLAGKQFGRLRVLGRATVQGVHPRWECQCICGVQLTVAGPALRTGNTRSCGCLKQDTAGKHNVTHGMSTTRIFKVWHGMMQRCYDKRQQYYHNYGGRGIRVCSRWHKFEHFLADMGEGAAGLSLDRKNNDGNYTKRNCYWATRKEQARNKRTNRNVTLGLLTLCVKDWAVLAGINESVVRGRLNRGWAPEAAVLLPSKQKWRAS